MAQLPVSTTSVNSYGTKKEYILTPADFTQFGAVTAGDIILETNIPAGAIVRATLVNVPTAVTGPGVTAVGLSLKIGVALSEVAIGGSVNAFLPTANTYTSTAVLGSTAAANQLIVSVATTGNMSLINAGQVKIVVNIDVLYA